jgi:RNA polymerase sigma-70 factor (ECF subfamily)
MLLAELEWVRRLAGALVRDPALADDVAQDAWVAALAGPGPRGSSPRAWLAAVTRNAARLRARREGRRRQLEPAAARDEALPPTDALVERAAVQRSLVDCVLALPDPYRRALLLRYFEGLAPGAIAEREGVPEPTVKTRLRRGLERLRERLDAAHGGRRAWSALLAPLVPKAGVAGAGVGVMLMATKVAIGGAAAAVLIAVGAVLWQASRAQGGAAQAAGGAPEVVALAPAEPPAELLDAGAEPARGEVPAPAPGSEAARAAPAALAVRVVADATGAPVPGAEVFALGAADFRARALAAGAEAQRDPAGLLLASGARSLADADGVARISAGEAGEALIAAGRAEGLFGFADLRPGAHPLELRLARDRTLRFRTVDAEGRPLPGVPVGLRVGPAGGPADWIVRTAGAEAQGALPHFDALVPPSVRGETPALVLPFPLAEPVEVALDDAALDGVVTLAVPPTGALRVDVLDEAGRPLPDAALYLRVLAGERAVGRTRGLWHAEPGAEPDGPQFPRVGLGLELQVELFQAPGSGRATASTRVAGPREVGELVRAELRQGSAVPVLTGAVVGPSGEPLAQRLGVLAFPGATWDAEPELQTDARGAFRVTAPAGLGRDATLRFPAFSAGEEELRAELALPLPLAPGVNDLGTLHALPPPVAARGRVVDPAGAPVEGASIVVLRRDGQSSAWVDADARSGADGAFALAGPFDAAGCELFASAHGYLCADPVPLRAGATDHELVLQPEARAAGRLRLPPGVPAQRLAVHARALALEPDWPSSPSAARCAPDVSGRFELDGLYPGRTELSVVLPGREEPLLVRELELVPGRSDLGELELSAAPRALRIAVRDEDGAPVARGLARVTEGGELRRCAFQGGELVLLALALPIDVELQADGFAPARLAALEDDAEVALARGPLVTLRLDDAVELPPPPLALEVALVPCGSPCGGQEEPWAAQVLLPDGVSLLPEALWREGAGAAFDARREVVLGAAGGGEHRLLWTLRAPADLLGSRRARELPGREALLRAGEGPRFTVAPDGEALQRARTEFGR